MDKNRQKTDLPDEYQIEAEMKEAEASGAHKEEIDLLEDVNMELAKRGRLDEELLEPTIEDLTR